MSSLLLESGVFRLSPREPRARSQRQGRYRVLVAVAVLAIGGLGATSSVSASASTLLEGWVRTAKPQKPSGRAAEVQTYRVPADVEAPVVVRTAEVQVEVTPLWVSPVSGALRDGFGPRPDRPVAGVGAFHSGQDIEAGCGTPIRAAVSGRVLAAGWGGSYGYRVIVESAGGVQTLYAHASVLRVAPGARVEMGDRIADVGTTGASTGCHLHFEVHVQRHPVDPVRFLRDQGVRLGG